MIRVLGRSGIEISAMGLGTARVGGLGFSRKGDGETNMPPSDADPWRASLSTVDTHCAVESPG